MKIRILTTLLLFLVAISCDNYDLKIDSEYRTAIDSYAVNDTIYFQSEQNLKEFDTIRIVEIDSIRQYPVIGTVAPTKEIYLRIQHLPEDKWKEPKITKKTNKNQPMITASNTFEDCCQIRIKYRGFESSIEKKIIKADTEIDTLLRGNPLKITEDKIKELYWSNESGIIGYQKFDGQTYRRLTQYNTE